MLKKKFISKVINTKTRFFELFNKIKFEIKRKKIIFNIYSIYHRDYIYSYITLYLI